MKGTVILIKPQPLSDGCRRRILVGTGGWEVQKVAPLVVCSCSSFLLLLKHGLFCSFAHN
jgi:hypothetical protein